MESENKIEFFFPLSIVSENFVKGQVFSSGALKKQILRGIKNTLNRMEELSEIYGRSPWSVGEMLIANMAKTLEAIKQDCVYEIVGFEEKTYSSGSM